MTPAKRARAAGRAAVVEAAGPAGFGGLRGKASRSVQVTARLELRTCLSRAAVIEAVEVEVDAGRLRDEWTIESLSRAMQEREYRVRAVVGWLIHQNRVIIVGELLKVSPIGRHYPVPVYKLTDVKKPTDWVGLYRAFGR